MQNKKVINHNCDPRWEIWIQYMNQQNGFSIVKCHIKFGGKRIGMNYFFVFVLLLKTF